MDKVVKGTDVWDSAVLCELARKLSASQKGEVVAPQQEEEIKGKESRLCPDKGCV